MFANRAVLTGTNVTVQGTTAGASTEPGENTGDPLMPLFYTVWYAWTAPTGGVLKVSASASDFFILVSAYNGTAIDALTTARTSPDGRVVVAAGDTIIF